MIEELTKRYGFTFEKPLVDEINQVGSVVEAEEGQVIIEIGQYIRSMPLLLSGVIKIMREDMNGDELLLYFLEPGDTCAMTLACCLGQTRSEIKAVAETDIKLIMIPIRMMETWTAKYPSWRKFVFESYHQRLNEMLAAIDSIAFLKMDDRLLKHLKKKSRINSDSTIYGTHQQIAIELNTSRVVISRLLKKLENMGIVELHRNHIKVLDL